MCVCVCKTEKESQRSGELWRNEGVQGQSEGTDLFSQPVDEGLICGGSFFFFPPRGRGRSLLQNLQKINK